MYRISYSQGQFWKKFGKFSIFVKLRLWRPRAPPVLFFSISVSNMLPHQKSITAHVQYKNPLQQKHSQPRQSYHLATRPVPPPAAKGTRTREGLRHGLNHAAVTENPCCRHGQTLAICRNGKTLAGFSSGMPAAIACLLEFLEVLGSLRQLPHGQLSRHLVVKRRKRWALAAATCLR